MKLAQISKKLSKTDFENLSQNLELINKFSRRPLSESEVYIFSMILCDNDIDRDFEKFSDESLETLKLLFLGKTGIFDHIPTGSNQTARIFFTEVITDSLKKTSDNKPYKYLLAKAYMVKSEKNKDLILEIDAGIKKEISVGCSVKSKICSICGLDNKTNPCSHIPGKTYDNNDCFFILSEPSDAYEWSFVAIPAQVNAGIIKNYNNQNLSQNDIVTLTKPEEIKKSLISYMNFQKSCFLSQQTIKSLVNYILDLEKKSIATTDYIKDLKDQVYKMMCISQPFLSQDSIDNIIKNLSYQELKDLKNNLSSELDISTIKPQLTPVSINQDCEQDENIMFKI